MGFSLHTAGFHITKQTPFECPLFTSGYFPNGKHFRQFIDSGKEIQLPGVTLAGGTLSTSSFAPQSTPKEKAFHITLNLAVRPSMGGSKFLQLLCFKPIKERKVAQQLLKGPKQVRSTEPITEEEIETSSRVIGTYACVR